MTEIYKELIATIKVDIGEAEKKFVDRYCACLKLWVVVLSAIVSVTTIWAIYGIFQEHPLRFLGYPLFLILFIVCMRYKAKQLMKIRDSINEECNPEKGLSYYMSLASKVKKQKKNLWENSLYCIGLSLFYAGRFEDCKKILPFFDKYCKGPKGGLRYTLLCMILAYQQKDVNALTAHAKALEELLKTHKEISMQIPCEKALKYPALLDLKERGEYEAVHGLLSSYSTAQKVPVMTKVINNYCLYHTAKAAGMEKEAAEHKAFVLEYGGTTFYKKELEKG